MTEAAKYQPRVKALEWHGEPEWCFADTPVGHYTISRRQNPACYRVESHGRDRMMTIDAPTPEVAKTIAQADYERRILACLVKQPCGLPSPSAHDCPNMKEVGGGMEGERYRCEVCGNGYFLDYDEMR